MDRQYIENEQIVDRYLAGELTVREARDFEKYCLEHPDLLNQLPIPVRLKARLSRRPQADSETGIFRTIPSSATRAALEAAEDGFDADEAREEPRGGFGFGSGASRLIIAALLLALIGALIGLISYGRQAGSLAAKLEDMQREQRAAQMQAPSTVETYRVQPVRSKPERATLAPGWMMPPQLIELRIDASEGRYSQFRVTITRADGTHILQVRRVARDSNKELRLGLNSSALGRGEFLIRIDGYTWRGQTQTVGWLRLDLT